MSVWHRLTRRAALRQSPARRRLLGESLEPRTVLAAPVAAVDFFEGLQDTPLTIEVAALVANDRDDDGDALSAALALSRGPDHGRLTINPGGKLVYEPNPGFYGLDVFYYYASDSSQFSSQPTEVKIDVKKYVPPAGGAFSICWCGSITISTAVGINSYFEPSSTPIARNDYYETAEDTPLVVAAPGVLKNDSSYGENAQLHPIFTLEGDSSQPADDLSAEPLAAELDTPPAHGTVSLNPDGGFRYVPDQDYFGNDQYVYRWTNHSGETRSATVFIEITPVNDPPVVNHDRLTSEAGRPLRTHVNDLKSNDRDVDNAEFSLLVPIESAPQHGSLALANANLIYTPDLSYLGTDEFAYFATDGELFSAEGATVSIELTPPVRHNRLVSADVNADADVSAIDALLVINFLNAFGSKPVAQAAQISRELLDVNGDGFVAPSDALAVIDDVNARRPAAAFVAALSPIVDPGNEAAPGESAATHESLLGVSEAVTAMRRPGRRGR